MSGNSAKGVANKTDAHDTPRAQYPPSITIGATRADRQLSASRQGDLNDRNGAHCARQKSTPNQSSARLTLAMAASELMPSLPLIGPSASGDSPKVDERPEGGALPTPRGPVADWQLLSFARRISLI